MTASLPVQIQNLIRVVVIIRTDSISSLSMAEFADTYLSREQPCEHDSITFCGKRDAAETARLWTEEDPDGRGRCCEWNEASLSFEIAASTSAVVLRGILDLSCHIQLLTDFFLHTMLGRCKTLEPSHLMDPGFQYKHKAMGATCPQRRPLATIQTSRFRATFVV
jgi:hypothetical protein